MKFERKKWIWKERYSINRPTPENSSEGQRLFEKQIEQKLATIFSGFNLFGTQDQVCHQGLGEDQEAI
jgi:hypothetical protein